MGRIGGNDMMGMTRAEAINILERKTTIPGDGYTFEQINEALDLAIAALRFPTREMVERMREEWKAKSKWDKATFACSRCGHLYGAFIAGCANFCPSCGAPMTDEAVDMMLERWKEAAENA